MSRILIHALNSSNKIPQSHCSNHNEPIPRWYHFRLSFSCCEYLPRRAIWNDCLVGDLGFSIKGDSHLLNRYLSRGNPYGLAVVAAFSFPLFSFGRIFYSGPISNSIYFFLTLQLVIGSSWQDHKYSNVFGFGEWSILRSTSISSSHMKGPDSISLGWVVFFFM